MPSATQTTLTLNEFMNLMKGLELGGHIRHCFTIKENVIQLPHNVTISFRKLEMVLNDPNWIFMGDSLQKYFQNFVSTLTNAARNSWRLGTTEHQHAEYLLGLLLHNNPFITIDGQTFSFQDYVYDAFPGYEINYILTGYAQSREIYLPEGGYDFFSEAWRSKQNYPTIAQVTEVYQKEEERKALEAKALAEREELQKMFQAYQDTLVATRQKEVLEKFNRHCFKDVLSLEQFSYVLQGFIKSGKVQMARNPFNLSTPVLPPLVAQRIDYFINAMHRPLLKSEKKALFIHLMKDLIAASKQSNIYFEGSQLLLGFLAYHNLHIYDGERTWTIPEIWWLEANEWEKLLCQVKPELFLPFNTWWLMHQNFPGRDTIELLLTSPTPKAWPVNYLPGFQNLQTQVPKLVTNHQPVIKPMFR